MIAIVHNEYGFSVVCRFDIVFAFFLDTCPAAEVVLFFDLFSLFFANSSAFLLSQLPNQNLVSYPGSLSFFLTLIFVSPLLVLSSFAPLAPLQLQHSLH